jgi:hypothetical protein
MTIAMTNYYLQYHPLRANSWQAQPIDGDDGEADDAAVAMKAYRLDTGSDEDSE